VIEPATPGKRLTVIAEVEDVPFPHELDPETATLPEEAVDEYETNMELVLAPEVMVAPAGRVHI
jgi:hypothetical protein